LTKTQNHNGGSVSLHHCRERFWRGVHSILISRPYFFALPNTIDGTFLSIFSPFNFSRLFISSNKQSLRVCLVGKRSREERNRWKSVGREKNVRNKVDLMDCFIEEKDLRNRREKNVFIFKRTKIPFNPTNKYII